jgi:hypothetical protein
VSLQLAAVALLVAVGVALAVRSWVRRAPVPSTALRCLNCPPLARRVRRMWVWLGVSWLAAMAAMALEYRVLRGW